MSNIITMNDIRNEVYKLLDEYSVTTASVDLNLTYRIDNQINRYYHELAEKERVSSYFKISQFPVENMLGETFDYDTHTISAVTYTEASANCFYFEYDKDCSVDILEASSNEVYTTLSTLTLTGVSTFTSYKNFASAAVSSDYIRLSFYGNNVYTIRNVAMYPYSFSAATASIPAFTPYVEYDLPSDYDTISRVRYRYNSDYGDFTDYKLEQGKLLISRDYSAEFIVDYIKMVSALTTATNTFEISDREVLLIPYAVAGIILMGNGFNVAAGQTLLNIYKENKERIKSHADLGLQEVSNYVGY